MKTTLLTIIIGISILSCSKEDVYICECQSTLKGSGWANPKSNKHERTINAENRAEAKKICENTTNYDSKNTTLNCNLK